MEEFIAVLTIVIVLAAAAVSNYYRVIQGFNGKLFTRLSMKYLNQFSLTIRTLHIF